MNLPRTALYVCILQMIQIPVCIQFCYVLPSVPKTFFSIFHHEMISQCHSDFNFYQIMDRSFIYNLNLYKLMNLLTLLIIFGLSMFQ